MDLEKIREILGWCIIMNVGLLLWWSAFLVFGREWVYRIHCRVLPVERRHFDAIHYAGIAVFKVAIFMLNMVPYFALRIVA